MILILLLSLFTAEWLGQLLKSSKRDLYMWVLDNHDWVSWVKNTKTRYWSLGYYDLGLCWTNSESEWTNYLNDGVFEGCTSEDRIAGSSKYSLWPQNTDKWGTKVRYQYVSQQFSWSELDLDFTPWPINAHKYDKLVASERLKEETLN